MSNRLRILFHCDLDGARAHLGRHALQAMERHIQALATTPPPTAVEPAGEGWEWIPLTEWLNRGRPKFRKRRVDFGLAPSLAYIFQVPRQAPAAAAPQAVEERPHFTSPVERAKWLWEHLPDEIRVHSVLMLTRENRRSCWRRSPSNPNRYGWKRTPSKVGQAQPATAVSGSALEFHSLYSGLLQEAPPLKKNVSYAPAKTQPKVPVALTATTEGPEASTPAGKKKLRIGVWA